MWIGGGIDKVVSMSVFNVVLWQPLKETRKRKDDRKAENLDI